MSRVVIVAASYRGGVVRLDAPGELSLATGSIDSAVGVVCLSKLVFI